MYHCGRNNPARMESSTSVECHKDTILDHTELSQLNFQQTQMVHQSQDKRRERNKLFQQMEANGSGFDMIVSSRSKKKKSGKDEGGSKYSIQELIAFMWSIVGYPSLNYLQNLDSNTLQTLSSFNDMIDSDRKGLGFEYNGFGHAVSETECILTKHLKNN